MAPVVVRVASGPPPPSGTPNQQAGRCPLTLARKLSVSVRVKYLVSWTGYNPQFFFDAVARMSWLKRLCFGLLRAKDISDLRNLTELEYLCIHQLSGPTTLRPMAALRKLRVLELGLNDKTKGFRRFRV